MNDPNESPNNDPTTGRASSEIPDQSNQSATGDELQGHHSVCRPRPENSAVTASDSLSGGRPPSPVTPACPVCGGQLIDVRAKLQCSQCHSICETCCEGGRG